MNHIDPAWLQTFVEIASTGALVRAADRVHRSPSALSVQLRQLESLLGVILIQRSTRRLELTAEGQRFLPYARRMLDLQQEAWQALRPVARQAPWRVGLSEYFQPARLRALLDLLQEQAGAAPLAVNWQRSAELLQMWEDDALDLAVVTADEPPDGSQLLHREPLRWVASPDWRPPVGQPLPLLLLTEGCPVRDSALRSLERRGIAHELRMTCSGSQAVVTALRAGWGLGCLNAAAVPAELSVLSERDPRYWPSPGRLAFHALARPGARGAVKRLKAWLH